MKVWFFRCFVLKKLTEDRQMGTTILTDCTANCTQHNTAVVVTSGIYLKYFGSDLCLLKEIRDMENPHHAVLHAAWCDW